MTNDNNPECYPYIVCPHCGQTSEEMEIFYQVQTIVFDCSCGWSAEIKQ